MIETELVAFATTSTNPLGADAGISVEKSVKENGMLMEHVEMARATAEDAELDETDGRYLNEDAADKMLASLGYSRIDPWTNSGGQWAAIVEPVNA